VQGDEVAESLARHVHLAAFDEAPDLDCQARVVRKRRRGRHTAPAPRGRRLADGSIGPGNLNRRRSVFDTH
jgi:hypothetical protein